MKPANMQQFQDKNKKQCKEKKERDEKKEFQEAAYQFKTNTKRPVRPPELTKKEADINIMHIVPVEQKSVSMGVDQDPRQ